MINEYNQNYNNQLNTYNDLMKNQQNYIDTWTNTQKETQQKQTDYNIGLINQNKQEAQKQANTEMGNAYIDYQKGLNQFSGNSETMASNGLSGTGFAKNQDIAMNITYQNRVSSAKSALQKANTDYDNQIQQALLTNDANLAEIALEQMKQSYQLALQGFEYRTTIENNKLNYLQQLSDTYFSREQTLQNRADAYSQFASNLQQAQVELNEKRKQNEEAKRQFDAELALERQKFNESIRQFNQELAYKKSSQVNYDDYSDSSNSNNSTANTTTGAVKSVVAGIGGILTGRNSTNASTSTTKTYKAIRSPALSGKTASSWYKDNISGKEFTKTELKNKLTDAYNKKTISANDVENILSAFSLK